MNNAKLLEQAISFQKQAREFGGGPIEEADIVKLLAPIFQPKVKQYAQSFFVKEVAKYVKSKQREQPVVPYFYVLVGLAPAGEFIKVHADNNPSQTYTAIIQPILNDPTFNSFFNQPLNALFQKAKQLGRDFTALQGTTFHRYIQAYLFLYGFTPPSGPVDVVWFEG